MSVEDKEFRVVSVHEEATEEYSFDALAKGLASGTISRRKALKLAGSAILGAGVLAFFPGAATAAEGARCPSGDTGCNVECRGRIARRRDCRCIRTIGGNRRCVRPCCSNRGCGSNDDCRSGEICMRSECCGVRGVCVPKCTAERPNYCDSTAAQSGATTPQPAGSGAWENSNAA